MKKRPPGIQPARKCKELQEIKDAILKMKILKGLDSLPQTGDMEPNQVLAKAYDELDTVIIAGFDKEGEYYFASSVGEGTEIVWLLEKMKHRLISAENT